MLYIMHLSKQVEGCNHLHPSKQVLDTAGWSIPIRHRGRLPPFLAPAASALLSVNDPGGGLARVVGWYI